MRFLNFLITQKSLACYACHFQIPIGGSSPMIEVFGNRMEITNPGKPLIDVFRFIDHTPINRNEKLASLMRRMNKEDKRRACYQHCCLQYLAGQKMSNESFRRRLGISNEDYSIASRIISDTISAGYIKLDDMATSKKY